jgi:hypothetical protein
MKPYPRILQIKINAPAVAFGDVLLRLCHGLMSRPSRTEPVTVFGKRPSTASAEPASPIIG